MRTGQQSAQQQGLRQFYGPALLPLLAHAALPQQQQQQQQAPVVLPAAVAGCMWGTLRVSRGRLAWSLVVGLLRWMGWRAMLHCCQVEATSR
jgi:hypothetical protein